jgi:hypothetical protein
MADQHAVDPKRLRQALLELADSILKLEDEGALLEATPDLMQMMGDLRRALFEYEVRVTGRLLPNFEERPEVVEAQRIVHEAARRLEEEEEEWWRRWTGEWEDGEE